MRFYDQVKVKVIAGDWGNWCASWRREKYVAFWWPDGWDWWKWASVYFVWDEWKTSLLDLHYKKQIKASWWEHGKWSQQYWENAEDVFVKVPVWTVVKDAKTWKIIWMIKSHNEKLLVAAWWRWWRWNMHFKNPTRQFPNFCMFWEPWEEREILAELQLVGDVTLIWFPSVWKSSIINTLSNAKAKVADYHFTTLVPNLWVVKHKENTFVLVDVPWLIEWAASGKWLWNEFLRHILKSKIWTFVLDISRFEESFEELRTLKNEIESYVRKKLLEEFPDIIKNESKIKIVYEEQDKSLLMKVFYEDTLLFEKFILFVVNKIDLVQDEEILEEYKQELLKNIKKLFTDSNIDLFFVNAQNKNKFDSFLNKIISLLKKTLNQDSLFDEYLQIKEDLVNYEEKQENYVKNITDDELDYLLKNEYLEEEEAENIQVWEVYNPKLAYYTWIIPWWNKEAEMFFYEVMNWEGISNWLEQNWVYPWDVIKVKSIYFGKEDRYLKWWEI